MRQKDPWRLLGVSRGASDEEVRQAYRAAARRTHPDLGGDPTAFAAVGEAWRRIRECGDRERVRGSARGRADTPSEAWSHARAVHHFVAALDAVEVDTDEETRTTTFRCPGGVLTLRDADLSTRLLVDPGMDLDGLPWEAVDDGIVESLAELLVVPAPHPARRRGQD